MENQQPVKTRTQKLLSFFKEVVIVIIGILIALSINNWNENRKDQAFIDKALYAINHEVQLNHDETVEILEKHQTTLDTIVAYLADDSVSIRQIFEKTNGFQVAELKNIGLRFFIANKAELIDYEIISDLSKIEFLRETLNMKRDNLTAHVYEHMEGTSEEHKYKLAVYLADMIDSENGIVEEYGAYLEKNTEGIEEESLSEE